MTSGSLSAAFCTSSWLMRLLIMPPGTWCEYTFMWVSDDTPRL